MFIEAIETVKCLDEGVIESVADANIGSIMGIGFPGWTGGVLQYINGYEGGLRRLRRPRARARRDLRRALHAARVAGRARRARRGVLRRRGPRRRVVAPRGARDLLVPRPGRLARVKLTHIGGPTALIELGGWTLLTDPTFDPPGGHYNFGCGTASDKVAGPAIAAADLPPIDAVLLSHDHHEDNLDPAGRALLPGAGVVVTTASGAKRLGGNAAGCAPGR